MDLISFTAIKPTKTYHLILMFGPHSLKSFTLTKNCSTNPLGLVERIKEVSFSGSQRQSQTISWAWI